VDVPHPKHRGSYDVLIEAYGFNSVHQPFDREGRCGVRCQLGRKPDREATASSPTTNGDGFNDVW